MKMQERMEMIEGVYNIGPKDILAAVELEKKTIEKMEALKSSKDRQPLKNSMVSLNQSSIQRSPRMAGSHPSPY